MRPSVTGFRTRRIGFDGGAMPPASSRANERIFGEAADILYSVYRMRGNPAGGRQMTGKAQNLSPFGCLPSTVSMQSRWPIQVAYPVDATLDGATICDLAGVCRSASWSDVGQHSICIHVFGLLTP